MSGGVSVETNALGRAGTKMKDAATGAGDANPADDLAGIGEGMAGSQSAGAATTLASTWRTRFRTWKTDAEGHGDSLIAAAETYVAVDDASADAQGGQP